ncbi:hypothetical protein AB7828_10155 [Tardiphaga sp. 215_C5_N2_1]|uniref:hypothetical protein n=1 Tax=Tardiphaga sp. 215_C5_N2_1 TaxID=3240774 RepID=UPI003F88E765
MAGKLTHKACFEFFGTVPKNPRWSWSGRSPDGKVVSVTFWQDQFEDRGRVYRSKLRPGEKAMPKAGRTELLENLKWSHENCGGVLHIIIAIPKDPKAEPRSILECFPQKILRMKLTHFDEGTGQYVAERIEPAV